MTIHVSAAHPSGCRHESQHRASTPLVASLFALLFLAGCASTPAPPAAGRAADPATAADANGPTATSSGAGTAATAATPASAPSASVPESDRIYFASGSADIDAAGQAKLRQHVERLRADDKLVVLLVGHTDPAGSRSYNLAVADRRTAAVARLLQSQGVSRKQIRRQNVGSTPTTPSCRTQDCQKLMRRVDIVYAD